MKIHKQNTILALMTALAWSITSPINAGVFAKLDGIIGEVEEPGFEGYIKLGDIKGEIKNDNGTVDFGEMNVSFEIDKASPRIMLACASGITIPEVTITLTRPDGSGTDSAYYSIKLTNVKITSYQNELKTGQDVPVDGFAMDYETIRWIYLVRDASGQIVETVTTGPLS